VELPGGETVVADDDAIVGIVVGATVLACEAGELAGRAAFDDAGLIVGLLIVPVGHAPLPF
jgi:hypothetical protein